MWWEQNAHDNKAGGGNGVVTIKDKHGRKEYYVCSKHVYKWQVVYDNMVFGTFDDHAAAEEAENKWYFRLYDVLMYAHKQAFEHYLGIFGMGCVRGKLNKYLTAEEVETDAVYFYEAQYGYAVELALRDAPSINAMRELLCTIYKWAFNSLYINRDEREEMPFAPQVVAVRQE